MVGDNEDRQTRLKIKVLEELDKLPSFNRKDSYSKRIQTLIDFSKYKEGFEKWQKNQNKTK